MISNDGRVREVRPRKARKPWTSTTHWTLPRSWRDHCHHFWGQFGLTASWRRACPPRCPYFRGQTIGSRGGKLRFCGFFDRYAAIAALGTMVDDVRELTISDR
jgi:hypothetical protein